MSFEELFDSGKGNLHLCYTWVVDNLEEINKNTIEYGKKHLKKLFINNNNVNVDDLKFEILLKECDYGKMPAENRVYLKCVNSSGEEAFIYLVSTYYPFEYVIKTKNYIKTIDVIFPLGVKEKIRKVNNSNGQYDFCIKDVITKKEGIYNAKNRKYVIEEQYDSLCENKTGFEAFLNGYKGLVNPYNKSYNIPIKYKNLNYYNKSCACDYCNYHNYNKNFNSIVFTERENHIGCYCYMLDYKKKNINYKGWYDFKYIKKRYIPNLFDKIEIYNIDDKRKNIFLKVWLNNKCGILDVYNKKFLAPIIFDEITKHEIIDKESFSLDEQIIITDNSVENIKEKYNIYGVIEGKTYKYDGNNLVKLEETKIEYPKTYELVKRKIEKQKT